MGGRVWHMHHRQQAAWELVGAAGMLTSIYWDAHAFTHSPSATDPPLDFDPFGADLVNAVGAALTNALLQHGTVGSAGDATLSVWSGVPPVVSAHEIGGTHNNTDESGNSRQDPGWSVPIEVDPLGPDWPWQVTWNENTVDWALTFTEHAPTWSWATDAFGLYLLGGLGDPTVVLNFTGTLGGAGINNHIDHIWVRLSVENAYIGLQAPPSECTAMLNAMVRNGSYTGPSAIYIGLCDDSFVEPTGGWYARRLSTWSTATSGAPYGLNQEAYTWGVTTTSSITKLAAYVAGAAVNSTPLFVFSPDLPLPIPIGLGNVLHVAIGALSIGF